MYLNNKEKQDISKEIEALEKKSSVELVAVITKQSGSYKFETISISLFLTVIVSLISLIFDISSIKLFQIEILSFFFFFFLLSKFNKLLLSVIPKSYKYDKASENAAQQFLSLGLNSTKTKQAIMFYVSLDEKYVEILTHSAIKEKIDDSYWQDIVNEFTKDVKNKEFSKGYIKAIKSCNDILIKEFPIKKDDINELSNEVIEL